MQKKNGQMFSLSSLMPSSVTAITAMATQRLQLLADTESSASITDKGTLHWQRFQHYSDLTY